MKSERLEQGSILCLMGPTAIGKTAWASALYDRYPGLFYLINSDASLFYREMSIGTGKPSPSQQSHYPHALMDVASVREPLSVHDFVSRALLEIERAFALNQIPVLVGGSMMYLKAFSQGLSPLPASDPLYRARLEQERTPEELYARLLVVDPEMAARLKPSDRQRILRAVEVYESSGLSMSQWLVQYPPTPCPYPMRYWALLPADRAGFRLKIRQRVEKMLAAGWIEECRALRAAGLHPQQHRPLHALGYPEIFAYLEGQGSSADLCDRIFYKTAQFAKRQLTWLRAWPAVHIWSLP